MADKLISGAVAADAQIANLIEPPTAGAHVGKGGHVLIPSDWAAQSSSGSPPPGCTGAKINTDNTMRVTDNVQLQLLQVSIQTMVTAIVGAPALAAFNAKVALGTIISAVALEG